MEGRRTNGVSKKKVMPLKKKHKKKVPVYYTEHWELGRDQGGRIRKKMEARKKSNSTKAARVH